MIIGKAPDWTPARLPKPPRIWVDARDASWSGTTLASIPNRGLDQGALTIAGATSSIGGPCGNLPTISQGTTTARIEVPLKADINTGQMSAFWFGKALSTGNTSRSIMSSAWTGGAGISMSFYRSSGAGVGIRWLANECCTVGTNNPSWQNGTDQITDLLPHSVYGQVGTTQLNLLDGNSLTLGVSGVAAVPTYTSGQVINLGAGGLTAFGGNDLEGINADSAVWMLFDYWLPLADLQKLEGYYHHLARTQGKLPDAHPFKNSRP